MWPKLVLSTVYVYLGAENPLSIRGRGFGVLMQSRDISGHVENPTGRGQNEKERCRKRG